MSAKIHEGQPVFQFGTEAQDAQLAVILLHGRGGSAEGMVPLAQALHVKGANFLIPQAALNRWYPNSAFGPLETNEPDLSSALEMIDLLVAQIEQQGFSHQQIAFGGFSQGACLASEYVARNARRYAGLFVLSGALIGPRGMARSYAGALEGTPVFIGGSDVDPWVAHDLISESARVLEQMSASVDFRTYPGMAHTVNQDEIDSVRSLLASALIPKKS